MGDGRRTYRVAEKIRVIVAEELSRVADPRFSLVTITSVSVSADLRIAKVYWVVSGDEERREEVTEAFDAANGVFRRSLSKSLGIRFVPELKFFYDDTFDTVDQVDRLFAKINHGS